ncbi:vitamin B12 dependent methionine synthase [Thermodesulfobacteriota bacterium]
MDTIVLNEIPIQIRAHSLMKRLRIKEESRNAEELTRLIEEACEVARPKAMYKAVYIESKGDDHIVVDGVSLKSRVLRVNVEEAHRVFPFVATCGTELNEWAKHKDDILERFWADSINNVAVRTAVTYVDRHITERYRPGSMSRMTPGSLPDWPIQQQESLFGILGNTEGVVGVRLAKSLMMIPEHSVSGIAFPTEASFESCQLCPREKCPGRRAPYDKDLYDRKYRARDI